MKWLHHRFLSLVYVALLASFVVIGCTGKQDPKETLVVCGNHSCGELAMVTTDTSSKGFHYLNPSLSPDRTEVLFSADWNALPADPKEPEDEYYVNFRQMITIPFQAGYEPKLDLAEQGAELIRLNDTNIRIMGNVELLNDVLNFDKNDPVWQDDTHIIFAMRVDAIGLRLFRADISDKNSADIEPLYLEPSDDGEVPRKWQHVHPQLSPDGNWLVFVRTGCIDPRDLDTCSAMEIWALDMSTAAADGGYGAVAFPITRGPSTNSTDPDAPQYNYTRLRRPRFSPDSRQIVFSSYLDILGHTGAEDIAAEIFTMDFDTTGLSDGTMELNRNVERVTFTTMAEGDPLDGILNYYPCFSPDGRDIFFISTRRAPATTVHARAIWRVAADGSNEPDMVFFTRFDDLDPTVLHDGTILLSSTFGFPTEMLDRLEEEAYQRIKQENIEDNAQDPETYPILTEVELRKRASDERRQLENFEGVMAHIYAYRGY